MIYGYSIYYVFIYFVEGFRQTITKYAPLVEAWKKINHTNIVQLKDVFITKAFNDSCKYFFVNINLVL